MLKKFEVENYMGFKNNLEFDLSTKKKYVKNSDFVNKGIVKKALVFGCNGNGKSNLCSALIDISFHLLDKQKLQINNLKYLNAYKQSNSAIFKYHFIFDKNNVLYEYAKRTSVALSYEKLYVNDELVLEYDYNNPSQFKCTVEGAENLIYMMQQNKSILDPHLSFVKYIYGNTPHSGKSVIKQLVDFVSGMLYFKSLIDGNRYAGYTFGGSDLSNIILNKGKLSDFQIFLGKMGINYELVSQVSSTTGMTMICVRFEDKSLIELAQIASSGTLTLWLFYCWMLEFENLTFLIIDEFDAYYHYDLGAKVLSMINSFKNYQSVITTHSTNLMHWEYTRPDCCYIISDNSIIKPICALVDKEIRESNNIEIMYKKNQFNEWE